MLALQTNLREPDRLMFSPDGQSLLATEGSRVQLWPRWLDTRPRPPKKVQANLERCALDPDAGRVFLYVSGRSHVRTLEWKSGTEVTAELPAPGPAWFHFDTAGGFVLVSHDRGTLTRFDLAPETKSGFRKLWSIDRVHNSKKADVPPTPLGSHYRFGAICAPAGTFAALEYRFDGGEPVDGLVVRSVTDGALLFRESLTNDDGAALRDRAGLKLSIHPSGQYFAYPHDQHVRFRGLARGVSVPNVLALSAECRSVAFHPSGTLLAATGASGAVALYDTTTWQVARAFAWDIGELRAVCFSLDGTRAATIGVGTVPGARKRPVGRAVVWDMDV